MGPEGHVGRQGPVGPEGKPSRNDSSYYSSFDGDPTQPFSTSSTTVGVITLPEGVWALHGVIPLTATSSGAQEIGCGVIKGGTQANSAFSEIGTMAGAAEFGTLSFSALQKVVGSQTIEIGCHVVAGSGSTTMQGSGGKGSPTVTAERVENHLQVFPPPP